ncbi:hypothetical protein DM02DRAFT_706397 [Periconia macrospinosa]|uniref:Uncharacterized protein n=1 Tax=Periconia macrospinosa TaxID=97972 RepID=A0A2V1CZJ0_9PLEO|nr:hypothetical protein DM02DRAFT_706397 [Periconia macrospinosa]
MSSALGGSGQPIPGPPYPPANASLGGIPSILPDVPLSVVFLVLFLIFGIAHMLILKKNKARGHKFIFNGPLAEFAFFRVLTTSLRIAWAKHPTSIELGIAATVFVYAGTILLFVVNWYFVQRIFRAQHPQLGWSKIYRVVHAVGIVAILVSLALVIVGAIQPFLTLNTAVRHIDHSLYLAGETYFAVFCFAPVIVVLISLVLPRNGIDKFGAGRFRNNISILTAATLILSCGAIFRCVIAWLPETPLCDSEGRPVQPPSYYSKASFYCCNFLTEILVVILYAITRVDLRFHVPDGCNEPGDYKRKSAYTIIRRENPAAVAFPPSVHPEPNAAQQ